MPMSQDEFDAAVKATCPACAEGNKPRYREETQEWVHDFFVKISEVGKSHTHRFCLATGLFKTFPDFKPK